MQWQTVQLVFAPLRDVHDNKTCRLKMAQEQNTVEEITNHI
jgi:hypothetical protein